MRIVRTDVDPSLGDKVGRTDIANTDQVAAIERLIATGGDVSILGNMKCHQFKSSGSFVVQEAGWADVFIIGKGGDGGNPAYGGSGIGYASAGGGGGGDVKFGRVYFDKGTHSVVLGSTKTNIGDLICASAGMPGSGVDGGDSGSGFEGGPGYSSGTYANWAGGGGAGHIENGQGVYAATGSGGDGGMGTSSDFTGTFKRYGGGGGGGGASSGGKGKSGGGDGGSRSNGGAGQPNSGGGGGGGSGAPSGGAGGSGFVAIKYITNTDGYYTDAKVTKGPMDYSYIPKMINDTTFENTDAPFAVSGWRAGPTITNFWSGYYIAFNQNWADSILFQENNGTVMMFKITMDEPVSLWKMKVKTEGIANNVWALAFNTALHYTAHGFNYGDAISPICSSPVGSIVTHEVTFTPSKKTRDYTLICWSSNILNNWWGRIYEVELYHYYHKYIRVQ